MGLTHKQQLGHEKEKLAAQFLIRQGLRLLQQNYRCFHGEIDLIMQDKDDIVFVEVRSRSRLDYGHAPETITFAKKQKLIKTAMHYLQKYSYGETVNSRFDVIGIHLNGQHNQIEWIPNAFSAED